MTLTLFQRLDRSRLWHKLRPSAIFAVILLFVVAMAYRRVASAHLWAEDGAVFLPQGLEHHYGAIFVPHAGFFQLLPRLITWAVLFFPLKWFAPLATFLCLVCLAATAALFTSPAYRWLVKNDSLRMGIGVSILFAPGVSEVAGNLCNLHNVLIVFAGLVTWRDLKAPWSPLLWIFFLLSLGSEGGSIVLLLPLAVRCWMARAVGRAILKRELAALACVTMSVLMNVIALKIAQENGTVKPVGLSISSYLRGVYQLAIERLALAPIFHANATESLRKAPFSIEFVLGGLLLAVLLGLLVRRYKTDVALVLSVPASILGVLVLTWIARDGAFGVILESTIGFHSRYGFATTLFGTILVFAALEALPQTAYRVAATVVAVVYLQAAVSVTEIGLLDGEEHQWARSARQIEEKLKHPDRPQSCVKHNPKGWEHCY